MTFLNLYIDFTILVLISCGNWKKKKKKNVYFDRLFLVRRPTDSDSDSDSFIWSYCRPRRPLLRPNLVAVAEATWKKIKYTVYMYVQIIVIIKSIC